MELIWLFVGIVLTATAPCVCCEVVFCHDAWGDSLDYAISGVTNCTGCYTPTINGTPQDVDYSITGINGTGTATWNGSFWEDVVGSVQVNRYASSDGTCSGDPLETVTADIVLAIVCAGENVLTVSAGAALLLDGTGFTVLLYANDSSGSLDTSMPNTTAGCSATAGGVVAGFDGTCTVSLP